MNTQHRLFLSEPTKLKYSNLFWTSKNPSEVCRILSCDFQDSNEFVIAEHILVWVTNRDGIVVNQEQFSTHGQLFGPCSSHHNREYANEVKQKRVIGHSSTTQIPPAVLDLIPGEYHVEEPCLYCDDYSESESDEGEPRALSTVKITMTVDPENSRQPVTITGRCHPVDSRQYFYHHTIEHCVIDPLPSVDVTDEFVSLYCTSYSTLLRHFSALKKERETEIKLLIFYSLD
ncbi:uncharacterized protein LOC134811692 isoform X2 [Bolinopsis microptera]|uniref:uncharacterized protein LOC134811692 isoform X2 n=1 Tax=Bolinopsis microptera TaxID=2820187 RepID=UPI00307983FC